MTAPDEPGGRQDDEGDEDGVEIPVDGPETVAENRLLASLGRQARTVNHARVLRLLELVGVAEAGSLDERRRAEAESIAHQLIGSAGTFGRRTASDDAVLVERYFAPTRPRRDRPVAAAGVHDVRRVLDRLRAEFATDTDDGPDPGQR